MPKPIHTFCELPDGTRNRQIDWSEGVSVLVKSTGGLDSEVEAVTELIAGTEETIETAEANVQRALAEIRKTQAQVPPPHPQRLMSTGYVRFANGNVWLLGDRKKGWAAFGFWFESWDLLFRTFDVEITGHGVDEHGPWWSAENIRRDGERPPP